MRDDLIQSFAEQFKIPVPAAARFATTIAEQCALLANRYEPEGAFTFEQLSAVETLGAEIGAAIISEFPAPGVEQRQSEADRNWWTISVTSEVAALLRRNGAIKFASDHPI